MLDIALIRVDASHADHFHARAEVAAQGDVVVHFHGASLLGESPNSLLWGQRDISVVCHSEHSTRKAVEKRSTLDNVLRALNVKVGGKLTGSG